MLFEAPVCTTSTRPHRNVAPDQGHLPASPPTRSKPLWASYLNQKPSPFQIRRDKYLPSCRVFSGRNISRVVYWIMFWVQTFRIVCLCLNMVLYSIIYVYMCMCMYNIYVCIIHMYVYIMGKHNI